MMMAGKVESRATTTIVWQTKQVFTSAACFLFSLAIFLWRLFRFLFYLNLANNLTRPKCVSVWLLVCVCGTYAGQLHLGNGSENCFKWLQIGSGSGNGRQAKSLPQFRQLRALPSSVEL